MNEIQVEAEVQKSCQEILDALKKPVEKEEQVFDAYGVKYNEAEAKALRLSRETKREINRTRSGASGRDLIIRNAYLYKMLLKYRIWLDEQVTEIENRLSEANCEVYFTDDSSVVIAREVEGTDTKVVFVEPLTYTNSNRARDFILGKDLKGKNIVTSK